MENYFYRSFGEEGIAFDEKLLKRIPVKNGQTDKLGEIAYTNITIVEEGGEAGAGVDDSADSTGEVWPEGLL